MYGIAIVIETFPEPVRSDIESGRIVIVAEGAAGDKLVVTFTLPENPFWLDRLIMYVPCDLSAIVCDKGLVAMAKSGALGVGAVPASIVAFANIAPTTPRKTRNTKREARIVLSTLSEVDSGPSLLRVLVFQRRCKN